MDKVTKAKNREFIQERVLLCIDASSQDHGPGALKRYPQLAYPKPLSALRLSSYAWSEATPFALLMQGLSAGLWVGTQNCFISPT